METLFLRRFGGMHFDIVDARALRSLGADHEERLDRLGGARGQRLDSAVRAVAHPAVEAELPGFLDQEVAIAHSLHETLNAKAQRCDVRLILTHANSRITSSSAMLSPFWTLTFFTRPSRSATSTFSIFIASTTASGSPALTSWPTATFTDTTRPGIGQSRNFDVSAATFFGIRPASAAAWGLRTETKACAPPWRKRLPPAARSIWTA